MAENKKSFLFYVDWNEIFSELKDAEAGKLIKHVLSFVNDENPKDPPGSIKMAWIPIKQQLKRDLKKWETIIEKRSEAGKVSAEKKKQNSTKSTHVEFVEMESTKSTVTVNDNVTVNVKDNVIKEEKEPKKKYAENVSMYEVEYRKLAETFGDALANQAIQFLSDYKKEKPYTTKSDYLTILRWVIDAVKKKNETSGSTLNLTQPVKLKNAFPQVK